MLIINGNIIVSPQREIADGFVLVQDGKIAATGPMSQVPKGEADILDAAGRTVMAGLVDAHCHVGMWEDGMGFEGDDGNEDTDPCTPHLRGMDAVNPMDRSFAEGLDWGVTTVVTGPGSSNPIGGQLCAMKTWGRRMEDMVIAPTVAMKFALGENPKTSFHGKAQTPVTRMAIAAIIREELQKARRYQQDKQAAAEDEELDPPEFDAKCEALIPVLERKIKAHFHAHRADDIFTAIRIAKEFDLDYVLIHCTEGHLIAGELAQEGCGAVCGPLLCGRTKPELRSSTDANPGLLAAAGVPTAICSDHPEIPLHYLALSAGVALSQGMTRSQALAAITTVPARLLGLEQRIGSLETGRDADILLFRGDLFALGVRPEVVVLDGRVVKNDTPCS